MHLLVMEKLSNVNHAVPSRDGARRTVHQTSTLPAEPRVNMQSMHQTAFTK